MSHLRKAIGEKNATPCCIPLMLSMINNMVLSLYKECSIKITIPAQLDK